MEVGVSGYYDLAFETPEGEEQENLRIHNGTTIEGLNYILNAAFRGGVQVTGWYFGFVNDSDYGGVSKNDTISSHPGWSESGASIGGGTYSRYNWDTSPLPAGGVLTGVPVSGGAVGPLGAALRGCFLTSSPSVGSPGILMNTAITAATYNAPSGLGLHVTYTIRLTPRS